MTVSSFLQAIYVLHSDLGLLFKLSLNQVSDSVIFIDIHDHEHDEKGE